MPAGTLRLVRAAKSGVPPGPVARLTRFRNVVTRRRHRRGLIKPRANIQTARNPFGTQYMATLTYADSFNFNIGALGTTNAYTFRLNSLFDPDLTGIGHQPYQLDQLSAIYKRYQVYGARVHLSFSDPSGPTTYVGYRVRSSSNTTVSAGQIIGAIREMQSAKINHLSESGSERKDYSFYVDMAKVEGVSKATYQTDQADYSAAITANPVKSLFLDCIGVNPNLAARTVQLNIKIVYNCRLTDYVAPAQS